MTESAGAAHRGEGSILGASGLLGVNNLQRAVDGFDKAVDTLQSIVTRMGQYAQSYERGSSAAGSWNKMSNWAGGQNGGNVTFNGQPVGGSGSSSSGSTSSGSHRAEGPATIGGGGAGGRHTATFGTRFGNGVGKAMYAMGAASKVYQGLTESTQSSLSNSYIYASLGDRANFGQANSLYAQGSVARSALNFSNWANNGADAAAALGLVRANAGGLLNGAAGSQLQGFVRSAAFVNPTMSGVQAAKAVTSFYQPRGYLGLRQVGVNTMNAKGNRQSPTMIANQILDQVDPGQNVRTPQAAAQLVTDPFSPLNLTLGNWLSNGLISPDEMGEIKDQIQAILKARQQGVSAQSLSHALATRNSSSKSRALLKKVGIDSSLQREKDLQASKRQGTVDRLPDFNAAVGEATDVVKGFTDALRDVVSNPHSPTGSWFGKIQAQWRGESSKGVLGVLGSELGGLIGYGWAWGNKGGSGGNNETRMSVGGALTGVSVGSQPHNAGRAAMGGAAVGGPANTTGHGGGGGSHSHSGGGRQHMILPAKGPLGMPFGASGSHWASGHHTGQDIEVPTGTPVHAPANGTVIFAGYDGPYGNLVKINHGGGIVSYMAHNSRLVAHVGAHVRQGQLIAYSGATGNVTGPHVHFEVRVNGTPVNPMQFVNGGRTVPASGGGSGSGSGGGVGSSGHGTNAPNGSGQSYDGSTSDTPSFYSGMGISGIGNSELSVLSDAGLSGGSSGSAASSFGSGSNGGGSGPGDNGARGGPKSGKDGSTSSSSGGITHVHAGTGTPSSNVALGKDLARSWGWGSGSQWEALYKLWMGESGWRTNADNPTSSAYGIPQAMLSLHKMPDGYYDRKTGSGASIHAYGGDPRIQIQWGLAYIKGAYGSPLNAYHKWLSRSPHWYDKGAWEIPEDETARVHKGEMIVPKKEADQIREILVNGNPYGAQTKGGSSGEVTLQFQPGAIVIRYEGTGSASADGMALGKSLVDALAQDDRIKRLQTGGRRP